MVPGYERICAFGDSYSDNGFSGGHGFRRCSETLTWVEYLAQSLALPLDDRAWGGAMTGLGNCNHHHGEAWSGLLWQVGEYLREPGLGANVSNTVFTLMCSVNDAWGGLENPELSAANLMRAVELLADAGAGLLIFREHSALLDPPGFKDGQNLDLRLRVQKIVNGANAITRSSMVDTFAKSHPKLHILYLQSDPLWAKIKAGAPGYLFELHAEPWLGTYTYPIPYKHLWYDEWHPSSQVHRLMADETLAALEKLDP
jgi:phospholipase/lecithinase/hemolysin